MKKTVMAVGLIFLLAALIPLGIGQRFASGDSQDDFNNVQQDSADRFDSGDTTDDADDSSRFDSRDSTDDYSTGDNQEGSDSESSESSESTGSDQGTDSRFDSGDSTDDSTDSRFSSGDSTDDQNLGDTEQGSDSGSSDSTDSGDTGSRFDSGDSTDDSNEDGSRFDSGDSTDDANEDGSRFDSGDSTDDANEDGSRFDSGDSTDDSNENSGGGEDDSPEDSQNEQGSEDDQQDSSNDQDTESGGSSSDGVSSIDWPDVVVKGQNLDVELSKDRVAVGEEVFVTGTHDFASGKRVKVIVEGEKVFDRIIEPGSSFRTGFTPSEAGNLDIDVSVGGSASQNLQLEVVSGLSIGDIDMPPVSDPGAVRACADITGNAETVVIYRNGEEQRQEDAEPRFCTLVNMEEGLNRIRFVARNGEMEAESSTARRVGSGGGFETAPPASSGISAGRSSALGAFSGSETRLIGSILAGLAVVAGVLYREGVGVTEFLSSIGS